MRCGKQADEIAFCSMSRGDELHIRNPPRNWCWGPYDCRQCSYECICGLLKNSGGWPYSPAGQEVWQYAALHRLQPDSSVLGCCSFGHQHILRQETSTGAK